MYVFAPRPHVIPFMNQREEEITMSTYAFNDAGQYTLDAISQCLKIVEKVAFNIASIASYISILRRQNSQSLQIVASNVPFTCVSKRRLELVPLWTNTFPD